MVQQLEQRSISMSPGSNPFATYVKDILSRSTKNTVTELMINRVCQLTLSSHNNILITIDEWPSLQIIKLGPTETQE